MPARFVALAALLLAGCPPDNASPGLVGESCSLSTSCARGLVCAQDEVCREGGSPGTVLEGDPCESSSQCALDLACASTATCEEVGSAGTAATSETCTSDADCRNGLECDGQVCIGLEVPFWPGADCVLPEDETGAFRSYFEIKRDGPLPDFYRLPYPNDLRNDDGLIDLSDHPAPPASIDVVGDVVGNVLRQVEQGTQGFGPNQAVFLRFSGTPDFNSVDVGLPGDGTVALVDVTPGADVNRGIHPSVRYRVSSGRTRYICQNWMAVWPGDGVPMIPGHTYAVILSRDITDTNGARLEADADFRTLLLPEAPTDTTLTNAWSDYGPLRDWLLEAEIDQARIGGGTVFTIQDTHRPPQRLREAVHGEVVPSLSGATSCADANPFADASDATRGCQTTEEAFHEVHAQVALPQFQIGSPPFKDAIDGGSIDFRGLLPQPSRTELVQVAMTIPKGPPPANGWPLVLYGHGTGGNYTSAIREGIVDMVDTIERGDETVRFATLSFDAPLHGPRATPANWKAEWLAVDPNAYDSDVLFYNPLNLTAARDNVLQAAADMWSLVRMAKGLSFDALTSPTGEALFFDPEEFYYIGHSQGGVVGGTFLSVEPDIQAAVLSGAGGLTIRSFLDKTSPHDMRSALEVGLAERELDRDHPVLNLGQQIAERADAVNHARYLLRQPTNEVARKPVLQIFGVGDTYSPDTTQFALARALGLQQVSGGSSPLDALTSTTLPATNNGPGDTTAVVHLYEGLSSDPHFVLFERADAQQHVRSFLGSAVLEGAPTIEGL